MDDDLIEDSKDEAYQTLHDEVEQQIHFFIGARTDVGADKPLWRPVAFVLDPNHLENASREELMEAVKPSKRLSAARTLLAPLEDKRAELQRRFLVVTEQISQIYRLIADDWADWRGLQFHPV